MGVLLLTGHRFVPCILGFIHLLGCGPLNSVSMCGVDCMVGPGRQEL
jgi:hypothetical protein